MARSYANAARFFLLCLALTTAHFTHLATTEDEGRLLPKKTVTGVLSEEMNVWKLTVDISSSQIQCQMQNITATFMMNQGSDVGVVNNVSTSLQRLPALAFFGDREVFEIVIPPGIKPGAACTADPSALLTVFVVCNNCRKIKGVVRFALGRPFRGILPSQMSGVAKTTGAVSVWRFSVPLHRDILTRKRGTRFTAVYQFPPTESGNLWVDAVRPQTFLARGANWYKEDRGAFTFVYVTLKVPEPPKGNASLDVIIDVSCRTCPKSEPMLTYAPEFPAWASLNARKIWHHSHSRGLHILGRPKMEVRKDHGGNVHSNTYQISAGNFFCSTTLSGGFSFHVEPWTTSAKAFWKVHDADKYPARVGVNGPSRIALWPAKKKDVACSGSNAKLALYVTCEGCTVSNVSEVSSNEPAIPAYESAAPDVMCSKQWKNNVCRFTIDQRKERVVPHYWSNKNQCKDFSFTGGLKRPLFYQFSHEWRNSRLENGNKLEWSLSDVSQCECDALEYGVYRYLEADETLLNRRIASGTVARTDHIAGSEKSVKTKEDKTNNRSQTTPVLAEKNIPDDVTDEEATLPKKGKNQSPLLATDAPRLSDHTGVSTKVQDIGTPRTETPTDSVSNPTPSSQTMKREQSGNPCKTEVASDNKTTSAKANCKTNGTSEGLKLNTATAPRSQTVEPVKTELEPNNDITSMKVNLYTENALVGQNSSSDAASPTQSVETSERKLRPSTEATFTELKTTTQTTLANSQMTTDTPSSMPDAYPYQPETTSSTGAISAKNVGSPRTELESDPKGTPTEQTVRPHQAEVPTANKDVSSLEVVKGEVREVSKLHSTGLVDAANNKKNNNEVKTVPAWLLTMFSNESVGMLNGTTMEFNNWVPKEEISQKMLFLTSFCFFKEDANITSVYLSNNVLLAPVIEPETRFACYFFGSCDIWEVSPECSSDQCSQPKITITGDSLPRKLRWRVDRAADLGKLLPIEQRIRPSRAGWYGTVNQVLRYNITNDLTQFRVETTPVARCLSPTEAYAPRGVRKGSNPSKTVTQGSALSAVASFVYIRPKFEFFPTKILLPSGDLSDFKLTGLISAVVLAMVATCSREFNLR